MAARGGTSRQHSHFFYSLALAGLDEDGTVGTSRQHSPAFIFASGANVNKKGTIGQHGLGIHSHHEIAVENFEIFLPIIIEQIFEGRALLHVNL